MIRFLLVLLVSLQAFSAAAQISSRPNYLQMEWERQARLDSLRDSTLRAQDSLKMQWIGMPDQHRPNRFLDSIRTALTLSASSYQEWKDAFASTSITKAQSLYKFKRMRWTLGLYALLLIVFSAVRLYYSTQLKSMMHAFFSNSALLQLNKEENIFNKWPFVFLFLLFSLTCGLFFYLGFSAYLNRSLGHSVQLFLLLSAGVFSFVLFKVWITKALGFIFQVKGVSREYVSIVYLCYFNGAMLLLPSIFIFLFSSIELAAFFFVSVCILLTLLFLFQVLRLSMSILKVHKFSKFYLILYFCTLEIGPMLILIKLLDYNLL